MSLKNRNLVNPKKPKRIAIVIANPSVSTTAGWPVGFWWSELSHPYIVLAEEGGPKSKCSARTKENARPTQ